RHGFLVFGARFAQPDMHVDQAGAETMALAVDHLDIAGKTAAAEFGTEIENPVAFREKRTLGVQARGRVEQACVGVELAAASHSFPRLRLRCPRAWCPASSAGAAPAVPGRPCGRQ